MMFAKQPLHSAAKGIRSFSTSPERFAKLRIGYIPEHFSTPLAFAQQHFRLEADLIPVPTGTGTLTSLLKSDKADEGIDVAIGLTEGFVSDLGKTSSTGEKAAYGLVGTYVDSPLRWGISTGGAREDLSSAEELEKKRVGVSRMGSGSHIMSAVLADQNGWGKDPFEIVVAGKFDELRKAVGQDRTADFFMWEHFTTKHFWDNGELKRIGEIYTPWPSWMIAARNPTDPALQTMAEKINQGITYYLEQREESIAHITSTMQYSKEDAEEWMKTVKFTDNVRGVDPGVVDSTISILQKAGVLDGKANSADMVAIKRAERGSAS